MRRSGYRAILALALLLVFTACSNLQGDPSSRVIEALVHGRVTGVQVDWRAEQHCLVLRGVVDDEATRARAGRLAQLAAGRTALVVNELQIETSGRTIGTMVAKMTGERDAL